MPVDIKTVTKFFFDKAAVTSAIDAGKRRALAKAGAFVRRRARSSIRKRKAVSAPGQPPSSHSGELRKLLFFAYDPASQSVVVGPAKFRRGEAPPLLEYGGTVVRRTKAGASAHRYRARPFMGPALAADLPKISEQFRDQIK